MMYEQEDFSFCKPHLVDGEYVVWKGKPEKGNLLSASDLYLIPFSLLWCAFAIFWEVTAINSGAPFFFTLFGLVFVCVGLYIVFGRFLWSAYIRKRTAYVITNKKIIRLQGNKVDMLHGSSLPPMQVVIHKNGNGTISFRQENYYYRRGGFHGRYRGGLHFGNDTFVTFSLDNIPDVARVQEMIANMQH